jgi:acyl phosphate:glycerol-3-phosphate acyltransferase
MVTALLVLFGYLLGSVSFAIVVSHALGLPDPRTFGSRNPGATNVMRSGDKAAALLTLAGDAAKGWVAVSVAAWLAPRLNLGEAAVAGAALGVFAGHIYPIFFQLKGGKGVATAFGIVLALDPRLGLATLAVWLLVFAVSRISSLSALVAGLSAPALSLYFLDSGMFTLTTLLLALVLVWRHKDNIRQLLRGDEARFRGSGKS